MNKNSLKVVIALLILLCKQTRVSKEKIRETMDLALEEKE